MKAENTLTQNQTDLAPTAEGVEATDSNEGALLKLVKEKTTEVATDWVEFETNEECTEITIIARLDVTDENGETHVFEKSRVIDISENDSIDCEDVWEVIREIEKRNIAQTHFDVILEHNEIESFDELLEYMLEDADIELTERLFDINETNTIENIIRKIVYATKIQTENYEYYDFTEKYYEFVDNLLCEIAYGMTVKRAEEIIDNFTGQIYINAYVRDTMRSKVKALYKKSLDFLNAAEKYHEIVIFEFNVASFMEMLRAIAAAYKLLDYYKVRESTYIVEYVIDKMDLDEVIYYYTMEEFHEYGDYDYEYKIISNETIRKTYDIDEDEEDTIEEYVTVALKVKTKEKTYVRKIDVLTRFIPTRIIF